MQQYRVHSFDVPHLGEQLGLRVLPCDDGGKVPFAPTSAMKGPAGWNGGAMLLNVRVTGTPVSREDPVAVEKTKAAPAAAPPSRPYNTTFEPPFFPVRPSASF